MDLFFKIVMAVIGLAGTAAAIYNIITARAFQKQVADAKKLDDTAVQTQRNTQEIAHLAQRFDEYDKRSEKRLDKLIEEVAAVKTLFTDFVIENLQALVKARQ
jgi:biopolymer transport protein ExbB/TolQ